MAKPEETKAPEGPKVEANVFLSYPTEKGDVSVHFKVSTDGPEALEDIEQIIKEKVEEGIYKPGNGKGASSAPSQAAPRGGAGGGYRRGGGGRSGGGNLPDRFEQDGVTWYVNESRKSPGTKYIGRKGAGGYEYLDWEDAPDYIRQAYGK